ncbi:nuclear transport factor 2 family protein [Mucilaginibacter sp. ZT4R22]|uniref:Nuclear transport factor 2 family protein n=1 Tax=Mucilaginibacter pankratovii TaxID=2772110 RepID=A0ABR7WXK1_9SPHI|nr:nuclear transport factor 2 family protein [Mucilaginibacter pankratovii]MBD1366999.1 nuclear transport factor 2 family protein [Mucilaginibacter pankratovii]
MKNLKSIILGLALLVVCGAVKANPIPDNESLTATHAVNTYVDAITRGKLAGLNDVLDQTVKFSMLRGKKMLSFDKKQMMEFFKGDKNVEQTCTTSTDIVESNADIKVVKVDMKYDGFTRSNYVTVTNTGDGWKITNVYSVFK